MGPLLLGLAGIATACSSHAPAIALAPVAPVVIPPAPAAGRLRLCDSIRHPTPLGFLADGRAVIVQGTSTGNRQLVRAWDFGTNALETLFDAADWGWNNVGVTADGRRLFEITGFSPGGASELRIFDVAARGFRSPTPLHIAAAALSSDGELVLDHDLRRFTSDGQQDFDFGPLVASVSPEGGAVTHNFKALSPSGEAVAVVVVQRDVPSVEHALVIAHRDGRVLTAEAPIGTQACGACALAFSPDEHHVSFQANGGLLVWEVETARLVRRIDEGVTSASFTHGGARLLTTSTTEVLERDLDGGNPVRWSVDPHNRVVSGPRGVLGNRGHELVVLARDGANEIALGRWGHPIRGWTKEPVAVTNDSVFTVVGDWETTDADSGAGPLLRVARFAATKAGPVTTFTPGARGCGRNDLIRLSDDEQRLLVVLPDSVRILDAATLNQLAALPTESGPAAWSPDGRYVATTPNLESRDACRESGPRPYTPSRSISIWDARSGRLAARFSTPVYAAAIAFDETGRRLHGWGTDITVEHEPSELVSGGTIVVFRPTGEPAAFSIDVETGAVTRTDRAPFIGSTRDLVVETQNVVRLSTGNLVSSLATADPIQATFSGDMSLVALQTNLGAFRLHGVQDGHLVADGPSYILGRAVALSRDGRRMAFGTDVYCLDAQ